MKYSSQYTDNQNKVMPHRILLQQSVYNTLRSVFPQIIMSVPSAHMLCGYTWFLVFHEGFITMMGRGESSPIGLVIHRKEKTRRTCDIVLHLVSMQAGTCGKPLPFPHICIHTHGKLPWSLAYSLRFWSTFLNTFDSNEFSCLTKCDLSI